MGWKNITDDIIVSEGTFGFSFTASGTIYGGQVVKMAGPMQVVAAAVPTDNAIGVAAYSVTKGEAVDVYGPGNIVRCHSPSSTTCGADLYAGNNGCVDDSATYGGTSPCIGIALEAVDVAHSGAIRVLLK